MLAFVIILHSPNTVIKKKKLCVNSKPTWSIFMYKYVGQMWNKQATDKQAVGTLIYTNIATVMQTHPIFFHANIHNHMKQILQLYNYVFSKSFFF